MIGLLFGELKRLSFWRRVALVVAAAAIAFVANCGRAFFLVWIAARDGVAAVEQWHDIAGYAILGSVFLGTIGVAAFLARKGEIRKQKVEGRSQKSEVGNQSSEARSQQSESSPFLLSNFQFRLSWILPLLWLLFVELGVEAWYRVHERNLVATPTWNVRWPENAPGFEKIAINEDVAATLRYDAGRQGRWRVSLNSAGATASAIPASCSMFFFRWEPGTTSILRARAHRPDVCLPNTGWRVAQDFGVQTYRLSNGTEMPFRHFSFARPAAENRDVTAHAFFCQREDRIPAVKESQFNLNVDNTSDWSRSDRVRVVLEGLRNQGQQVLEVVIMAPRAVGNAAVEAEFAKLVPQIVALDSADL